MIGGADYVPRPMCRDRQATDKRPLPHAARGCAKHGRKLSCATDDSPRAGEHGSISAPMLTIDDIRSIPLFSALADAELARLASTSADLHLSAGEFAVPEGGDRALYAVLAGKIEVIKTIDGIEKRLGWRLPGTIFGEVPMVFGSPF